MSNRLPLSVSPAPGSHHVKVADSARTANPFGNGDHERMVLRLRASDLAFLQGASERAFVTLSYSQSLDGSIAVSRSTPCSLSCRKSLEMTHMVRSLHDGLLVGIDTVLSRR
jgi:hypothetical protein